MIAILRDTTPLRGILRLTKAQRASTGLGTRDAVTVVRESDEGGDLAVIHAYIRKPPAGDVERMNRENVCVLSVDGEPGTSNVPVEAIPPRDEGGAAASIDASPGGDPEMAEVITALDALALRVARRRPASPRRRAADEREQGHQGWGGAGVIWSTKAECFNPRTFGTDPLVVVTMHAHAVGRLITELPRLVPIGFHWSKYNFYDRLAGATLAYQEAVGSGETERGVCLAILAEARVMAAESFAEYRAGASDRAEHARQAEAERLVQEARQAEWEAARALLPPPPPPPPHVVKLDAELARAIAKGAGKRKVIAILRAHAGAFGADPDAPPHVLAVLLDRPELHEVIGEAGIDARWGPDGETACHVAARLGQDGSISWLKEQRADTELPRLSDGREPLHLAAAAGHDDCVELLMVFATRLPSPDANGQTPADLARAAGHPDIADLLAPDEAPRLPDEGAPLDGFLRENEKIVSVEREPIAEADRVRASRGSPPPFMRLTLPGGTTYRGTAAQIVEHMNKSTPFSRDMEPMDFRKAQLDSWWVNGYRFRYPDADPTPEDVVRCAVECGIGRLDGKGAAAFLGRAGGARET